MMPFPLISNDSVSRKRLIKMFPLSKHKICFGAKIIFSIFLFSGDILSLVSYENSADPDQTAPEGSTKFAIPPSIL